MADSDGDGVPDARDACPLKLRLPVTANGCPDLTRIDLAGLKFMTATARLRSESFPLLDAVAAALKANPELYVQVAGYADAPAQASRKLWERRAETVIDYLVANNVDPNQLEARGYAARRRGAGRIALRVF
jgi:outer membrane protein OmpA-like peptidoglycan-associated protein